MAKDKKLRSGGTAKKKEKKTPPFPNRVFGVHHKGKLLILSSEEHLREYLLDHKEDVSVAVYVITETKSLSVDPAPRIIGLED